MDESFVGRILGYGSGIVRGTGGTFETFDKIARPNEPNQHFGLFLTIHSEQSRENVAQQKQVESVHNDQFHWVKPLSVPPRPVPVTAYNYVTLPRPEWIQLSSQIVEFSKSVTLDIATSVLIKTALCALINSPNIGFNGVGWFWGQRERNVQRLRANLAHVLGRFTNGFR